MGISKTPLSRVKKMYTQITRASGGRAHMTLDVFRDWLYANGFKAMMDEYRERGFDKSMLPTVKRLKAYKPLTCNNIVLQKYSDPSPLSKDKEHQRLIRTRYYRSVDKVISTLWNSRIYCSKIRNHPKPGFSKEWFIKWIYDSGFEKLYNNWVVSGFDTYLKPSVDRLDDTKPYQKDNIRLTTWWENKDNYYNKVIRTGGPNARKVRAYRVDGTLYKEYLSGSEAERDTGCNVTNITKAKQGKVKLLGGYIWIAEEDFGRDDDIIKERARTSIC